MTRGAPELHRAALKTGVRRLIAALGGAEAASATTRVVRSKLHAYGDVNAPDRHMPIDVLLDLETCLGQPIATAEMARLQGFTLLPMKLGDGDVAIALAEVARDCGKTLSDAMRAIDNNMPPAEVEILCCDLADLQFAVTAAIGILTNRKAAAVPPGARIVKAV